LPNARYGIPLNVESGRIDDQREHAMEVRMAAKNSASSSTPHGSRPESEWLRTVMYVAIAGIVVIAIAGGRVSIGQEGVEINTGGFAEYLAKAEKKNDALQQESIDDQIVKDNGGEWTANLRPQELQAGERNRGQITYRNTVMGRRHAPE
jgi:hypothetical protein